jgi:putative ABC transport system permease protein
MMVNYLKVAWRNLVRQKGYSFINIFGLAVGLACFLLLVLYIRFERSYDDFHEHRRDIYLATFENRSADYLEHRPITGAPLAPLLLQQFPAIEEAVRLFQCEGVVAGGRTRFMEKGFVFADDSFFRVFTFPLQSGDAAAALRDPFSIVITPEMSRKYFSGGNPLGKTLTYMCQGTEFDFTVSGVLKPIPANSHLRFDFLASFKSLPAIIRDDWFFTSHWDSPTWTYVKLKSGTDAGSLNRLLPAFCERFVDKRSYKSVNCRLVPLADVYAQESYLIGLSGNVALRGVLSIIAGFILLIACINFTNLATARSELRVREIGMRKVCGASRGQLLRQFLTESLVCSFLALLLAVLLFELIRPLFSAWVGKPLPIHFFADWKSMAIAVGSGTVTGLLAGIYPAFCLSRFQPHAILKSAGSRHGRGGWLRRTLVAGQFVVAIAFTASLLLMSRQMGFLRDLDLGFDRNQVIVLPVRDASVLTSFAELKNRWRQHSAVSGVTGASLEPGVGSQNGISINARGNPAVEMGIIYVDPDFVKVMGIHMLRGRDFSGALAGDASHALLLNEEALKKLNWRDGVGETVEAFFMERGTAEPVFDASVIGVVKNFNFRDLTTPMQPILMKVKPNALDCILIRLNGKRLQPGIDHVRRVWNDFSFNQPFEFSFLDSDIEAAYRNSGRLWAVIGWSTLLAILIACLGLFGLASFASQRRAKEIGVRKVLGASVPELIGQIAGEYIRLVLLANLLAWPAAYLFVRSWLRGFAYRTAIGAEVFLLSGLLALAIALLTVSYQAIRAARANPVESLRYE